MTGIRLSIARRSAAGAALLALAALMPATPAAAQDPFYKGKNISLIIASNAAGGYDTYGRLLARHLGTYLPGNPNIVVQNMPGAGGVRGANHLYNVAAKDGTVIGIFDQAVFLDQILGVPGIRADAQKFNWVGRLVGNSAVLFAWHTAAVKKIEDALTQPLIVAASGSSSRLNWTALNTLVGTKFKLIVGYEGPSTAKIAMERGEVEALSLPWPVLRNENRDWLKDHKVNLLLQTGLQKNADLPDLPRMIDLAKNENDRKVMEIFGASSVVGRAFVAPPGLPQERIAELRRAFDTMVKAPEFLADVERLNFDIDVMSGADMQAFFAGTNFSPALVERAREIAKLATK